MYKNVMKQFLNSWENTGTTRKIIISYSEQSKKYKITEQIGGECYNRSPVRIMTLLKTDSKEEVFKKIEEITGRKYDRNPIN
jgi:hypothetical protein